MTTLGKILIIDDNAKLLADALPMYGYTIDIAADGKEGVKLLVKNKNYDVILLDVIMPQMDGWEVLKLIRGQEQYNNIPIIMLTSVDEVQKQVSGLKQGADDYITKPFILPNLLARIEAALRRKNWSELGKKNSGEGIENSNEIAQSLTLKEREILGYLAKGASNQEISDELFVKEVTIKSHLNNIYKKLNVENRVQAVLLAQQLNIL